MKVFKIFLRLKWEETKDFRHIVFWVYTLCGSLLFSVLYFNEDSLFIWWLFIAPIILGIILVFFFIKWIHSNWKEAKCIASEDNLV